MKYLKFLPVLVLVLFIFVIFGMRFYENKIANLYIEHALLIEKLTQKSPGAVNQFAEQVSLSMSKQSLIKFSTAGQRVIDFLTFGTSHCFSKSRDKCRVYTNAILNASELHYQKIKVKDPITSAVVYKWYELLLKAVILALEASIVVFLVSKLLKKK